MSAVHLCSSFGHFRQLENLPAEFKQSRGRRNLQKNAEKSAAERKNENEAGKGYRRTLLPSPIQAA